MTPTIFGKTVVVCFSPLFPTRYDDKSIYRQTNCPEFSQEKPSKTDPAGSTHLRAI